MQLKAPLFFTVVSVAIIFSSMGWNWMQELASTVILAGVSVWILLYDDDVKAAQHVPSLLRIETSILDGLSHPQGPSPPHAELTTMDPYMPLPPSSRPAGIKPTATQFETCPKPLLHRGLSVPTSSTLLQPSTPIRSHSSPGALPTPRGIEHQPVQPQHLDEPPLQPLPRQYSHAFYNGCTILPACSPPALSTLLLLDASPIPSTLADSFTITRASSTTSNTSTPTIAIITPITTSKTKGKKPSGWKSLKAKVAAINKLFHDKPAKQGVTMAAVVKPTGVRSPPKSPPRAGDGVLARYSHGARVLLRKLSGNRPVAQVA